MHFWTQKSLSEHFGNLCHFSSLARNDKICFTRAYETQARSVLENKLRFLRLNTQKCSNCGNLKIIDKPCLCETDTNYDKICIVENLADMWVIDSANIYKGHYHILGGTINSQDNSENKNVLITSLVNRVKKNNLKEVIIATSATIEGQTTAHYIEDLIKNDKIKVTKLAQGLPVGGEIEQLDDGTLFSAFKNRVPITDS